MDCACVSTYDGGESAEFFFTSKITSIKSQICTECAGIIKVGEEYEHTSGKWEGRWEHYKTCVICQEIRSSLFSCGWFYSMIYEDLDLHIDENGGVNEDCLAGLSPDARAKVCSIIEDCWERTEEYDGV